MPGSSDAFNLNVYMLIYGLLHVIIFLVLVFKGKLDKTTFKTFGATLIVPLIAVTANIGPSNEVVFVGAIGVFGTILGYMFGTKV
jgi:hypothetical protein